MPQPVSLILTVRNERRGLAEFLDALAEQTEMPDEIVIVDGGSEDGTLSELGRWDERLAPRRVVVAPGANIAAGRNIAVRTASHDWIVCTDAGCRPVPGWLAALKQAENHTDLAAGTFVVEGDTPFERALAYTHYPVLEELSDHSRLLQWSHRLFGRDFRAARAGGRSMAFRRRVWEAVGGFPEHVYAGEDLAFTAAAVEHGFRTALVEQAAVRWRPRATWIANARMFAIYCRGDVRTEGRGRHLLRLTAWLGGTALVLRGGRAGRLLVAGGAGAYLWLPIRRARRFGLPMTDWWRIPALVALKDLSQLAGAGLGLVDRTRGVPQPSPRSQPYGGA